MSNLLKFGIIWEAFYRFSRDSAGKVRMRRMDYVTKGYEPADALRYFEEISAIPRGSGNEAAVADYICRFAEERGLEYYRDSVHNVIVKKPGSAGCENLPALMLQGHTDMVCVKLPDCGHDFTKDPLQLEVKDGWLTAKGTTLGADDGMACAYMLAFLAKEDYVHPPLECVFTSMEEIGLLGAMEIDASRLSARRLINMDGGESKEYESMVSCAGGQVYNFRRTPSWEKAEGDRIAFSIRGLLGGHSAGVVHLGRGNGLKLMARILAAVSREMPVKLASFTGGAKMNAIVSEADAVMEVPAGSGEKAMEIGRRIAEEIRGELSVSDPGFAFSCRAAEAEQVMTAADSEALITFLQLLPDGIRSMSREIEGLVVCSSNVGILVMDGDTIDICDCIRSSEDGLKAAVSAEMETLAKLTGFEAVKGIAFGGWKYDADSELRALCAGIYERMYGRKMEFQATHGGLECGEFRSKIPELDIMCIAPSAKGAHTPEESMNLESFRRVYDFLLAIFEELCR